MLVLTDGDTNAGGEGEKEIHTYMYSRTGGGLFLAPREKHTYTYTRTLHTMHTYVGSRNREGARGREREMTQGIPE